ncbi:hypothetical protein [Nocardia sp. NPDC004123]
MPAESYRPPETLSGDGAGQFRCGGIVQPPAGPGEQGAEGEPAGGERTADGGDGRTAQYRLDQPGGNGQRGGQHQ